MGILKVTIAVGDSQGRQFEELDVTVDTGSTYTAVPRAMLQRLGIPVERSLPSETADGRIVPVDVGEATIRLEGMQFHTPVIFAEENEPSLLGVVSLEQAALGVHPTRLVRKSRVAAGDTGRRASDAAINSIVMTCTTSPPVPNCPCCSAIPYAARQSSHSPTAHTCTCTPARPSPAHATSTTTRG